MQPTPNQIPTHWPTSWSVDPLWFEDDTFWSAVRPMLFDTGRWSDAESEILQATAILGLTPPDRVLDISCGPGRHLIPLARYGYRPTGVDRTESYLEEARQRAASQGVEIETLLADTRDLDAGDAGIGQDSGPFQAFQGALWLDSSIGYGPEADDIAALSKIRAMLEPGGRILIETLGLESTEHADGALEVEEHLVADQRWVMERRLVSDCSGCAWMEARWGPATGHPLAYRHRLYGVGELNSVLHEAGWHKFMSYGDLRGSPYDESARGLYVIAEA